MAGPRFYAWAFSRFPAGLGACVGLGVVRARLRPTGPLAGAEQGQSLRRQKIHPQQQAVPLIARQRQEPLALLAAQLFAEESLQFQVCRWGANFGECHRTRRDGAGPSESRSRSSFAFLSRCSAPPAGAGRRPKAVLSTRQMSLIDPNAATWSCPPFAIDARPSTARPAAVWPRRAASRYCCRAGDKVPSKAWRFCQPNSSIRRTINCKSCSVGAVFQLLGALDRLLLLEFLDLGDPLVGGQVGQIRPGAERQRIEPFMVAQPSRRRNSSSCGSWSSSS